MTAKIVLTVEVLIVLLSFSEVPVTVFLVYTVISPKFSDKCVGANRVDPDQTAPLGLH